MPETRRNEIEAEIRALEQLISQHDYIGVKIAMGRATADEYAEEIAQSNEWAARIEALRKELDEAAE